MFKKILDDTLRPNGKWSLKRVASFVSFHVSAIYAFLPVIFNTFKVQEFVFWGFITYSASTIGITVWNKKIDKG